MESKFIILLCLIIFTWYPLDSHAQCADDSNIYSFQYDGHTYELVKENRGWVAAAACAIERSGYLAEINDAAEQDTIFSEVIHHANIVFANTENIFGTSSIWIGGSDSVEEGNWIWDGNNDGVGIPFWNGGPGGSPVNGLYTNWGTSPAEPDNSGGQDHLTLIIDDRRINYGKWNDIEASDDLYYLVEHNTLLSGGDHIPKISIEIYPNPFRDKIFIRNANHDKITNITIVNSIGQLVKRFGGTDNLEATLDVTEVGDGMYFLIMYFETGETIATRCIK